MTTRKCRRCGEVMDIYEFRFIQSRNDYHHACVLCETKMKAEFYQDQVNGIIERRRRREEGGRITHEIFENMRARRAETEETAPCK